MKEIKIGVPVLEVVADVNSERAQSAAEELDFNRCVGDWRTVVNDPQVDIVDITTPTDAHEEKAVAGSGAPGELDSHIISLAPMLVGDFAEPDPQIPISCWTGIHSLCSMRIAPHDRSTR